MKTFVVLGMHRSATSLVAKSLNSVIFMGNNLYGANKTNPFGHYEEQMFLNMNTKILKLAGGSWDFPPPENEILRVGQILCDEIRAIVEKMNLLAEEKFAKRSYKEPLWGWKDPRTTLTIRCYLPYLQNPHYIVCFRNPEEIAKSLNAVLTYEYSLKLVKEYNKRLLKFLNEAY
jgi:hypothetical protein